MIIDATSSLVDVAFTVCTALDRVGTTAVLTGGSAATYYAPDAYQSDDLDFVITFNATGDSERVLLALGFERHDDFYRHQSSLFPLEFPPGPLMVGDEVIPQWNTDRLAAFPFWSDFSGLEQALAVYRRHSARIDLEVIRHWCQRERGQAKFDLFVSRLDLDET
jgi:hypothetical protein